MIFFIHKNIVKAHNISNYKLYG